MAKFFGGACVLILALSLLSCQAPSRPYEAEERADQVKADICNCRQIRQVLDTYIKAYQNHNLELLKLSLWEESSFYSGIVENVRLDFARFPTIRITFTEIEINFYSDGKRALVTLRENFRAENETEKHRQGVVLIEMIETEDEWRIVSLHWPAMMKDIPAEP